MPAWYFRKLVVNYLSRARNNTDGLCFLELYLALTQNQPKTASGRPPFDGGPILTTFAPDPEENPEYLVKRVAEHVSALEIYAKQKDADPDTVMELHREVYGWVLNLLNLERTLSPSLLPPGPGALHSIDYLLESENETVVTYQRLLSRLDDIRPAIELEVKLKRMIDSE